MFGARGWRSPKPRGVPGAAESRDSVLECGSIQIAINRGTVADHPNRVYGAESQRAGWSADLRRIPALAQVQPPSGQGLGGVEN